MDRLTRKELKTDKFAKEVEHTVDFMAHHRKEVIRYGGAALALVVLVAGAYFFRQYRAGVRERELAEALRVQDGILSNNPVPGMITFKTQQEKDKAVDKALRDLAVRYSGTQEGAIARFYLGTTAADRGDQAQAEKAFQEVIENGPKPYASLAKISLAQLYAGQGKTGEAEKLIRSVMANPTVMVSKEMATIELARVLANSKPQEARKLLEPLRTQRTAISKAAISTLGEIPPK